MKNLKQAMLGGGNTLVIKELHSVTTYTHRAAMRALACVAALFASVCLTATGLSQPSAIAIMPTDTITSDTVRNDSVVILRIGTPVDSTEVVEGD